MAWLSRNNFAPSDRLHADDLNNLANDQRGWGGDVNGGGHVLSNVILATSVLRASGVNVSSVFGRTGDVVAQPGDYTAAMVGAPPTTRQVIAGAGMYGGGPLSADVTLNANVVSVFGRIGAVVLTSADITGATGVLSSRNILTPPGSGLSGGGNLSADRTLSVVPDSTNQQVTVLSGSTEIGTRHAINFVNGANVTITVGDDIPNNRVNVLIASTGSTGGMTDPTNTLGDLIVRGPTVTNRLAVGANGQVLTADSTQPLGVKWAVPSSASAVTSVFSRTGAVTAQAGDYTAALVTNAVDTTVAYANPSWISNLAWTKITNAPAFMVDTLTTKGDLPVHTATVTTRLPVGADGTVLTADSAQGMGVRWGTPPTTPLTPWTTDIDAANHILRNTKGIGAGNVTPAANNPLSVLMGSADVGPSVSSALFSDGASQLQVGCSIHYGSSAAPWIQAYLSTGTLCPLVLQPAGTTGVGIGQTKPAFMLDVAGDINATGTYRLNGVPISTGGQSQSPWTTDIDAASHNLNNAAGLAIGAPVGATPMLRIQTPNPAIVMQGPTTSDVASIQMLAGSAFKWEIGVGHPNAGQFYIRDLNASGMRVQIDGSGNVGIGHPATYALDVAGDINCSGGVFRVNGVALGGVSSIFGRTGAIVAATGDYNAAQITNAVDVTQSYANPAWLTSLAWSKIIGAPATGVSTVFGRAGAVTAQTGDYNVNQIANAVGTSRQILTPPGSGLSGGGSLASDRTLAVIPDSTNQQVQVFSGGGLIATRRAINFVNGANVTISISDDPINNRADVAIASTGGGSGGGMTDPTTSLGDLIVRSTTAPNRLPVGLTGQVLTADSAQPLGVKWATPTGGSGGAAQSPWASDIDAATHNLNNAGQVTANTLLAKQTVQISDPSTAVPWHFEFANNGGTLGVVRSSDATPLLLLDGPNLQATVPVPLAVNRTGAPAFALDVTGDCNVTGLFRQNGVPLDLNGLVASVFSRTGAVTAQAGDYAAAQVTNAVSTAASYNDPAWITSLAWAKISGAPVFLADPTIQRGDLIVHGTSTTRIAVGTDGQVLTADSTQALGVKWAATSGGVSSVFGRTGVVVAASGDYTAAQVTNAVDTTQAYANPAWITSLAWSKITGVPATGVTTVFGRSGAVVATSGDYTAALVTNAVSTIGSYSDPAWITGLAWAKILGAPAILADPTTTLGDLIVHGTSTTRLAVGADGQVLTADSTQTLGVKWAAAAGGVASVFGRSGAVVAQSADYAAAQVTNAVDTTQTYADPSWITALSWAKITGAPAVFVDPTTTKGDIIARGSTSPATRLGVGTNNWVLTADNTQTQGVKWAAVPVASVFTRTGAVVAVSGDYTAAQVTNAVDTTQTYANPAWITSLAWSKITSVPAFPGDPTTTKGDLIVRSASAPATRLAVGATLNMALLVDSTQAQGVKWATMTAAMVTNAADTTGSYADPAWITSLAWGKITGAPTILADPTTTKGDLIVRSASATTRLPIGADGLVLIADSSQTLGLRWGAAAGGGGSSSQEVNVLALAYNGTALTNSTTATNLLSTTTVQGSLSIPANTVVIGSSLTIQVQGQFGAPSSSAPNLTLTLIFGSTTAGTLTFTGANTASRTGRFTLDIEITRTASATIAVTGVMRIGGDNSTNLVAQGVVTASTSPDWTSAQTLILQAQFSAANASSTIRVDWMQMTVLNPNAAAPSSGQNQTPWLSDIDAASHYLNYSSGIAVGTFASNGSAVRVTGTHNTGSISVINSSTSGIAGIYCSDGSVQMDVGVAPSSYWATAVRSMATISVQSASFGIAIGGNLALLVDWATNNVGIGKVPSYKLDVNGDVYATGNFYGNSLSSGGIGNGTKGSVSVWNLPNTIAGTAATRPTVGTDIGGAIIAHDSAIPNNGFLRLGAGNQFSYTGIDIASDSSSSQAGYANSIVFYAQGGNERMRLNGSGGTYLGLAVSNPTFQLQLAQDSAGKPSTSTWSTTSDVRLKQNIRDLVGGVDVIRRLHPVEAEYNGLDGTPEGLRVVGFLAHELREILPHCVGSHRGKLRGTDSEETPDILDVNIHEVLIHLVLAVKQLAAKLEAPTLKEN